MQHSSAVEVAKPSMSNPELNQALIAVLGRSGGLSSSPARLSSVTRKVRRQPPSATAASITRRRCSFPMQIVAKAQQSARIDHDSADHAGCRVTLGLQRPWLSLRAPPPSAAENIMNRDRQTCSSALRTLDSLLSGNPRHGPSILIS